MYPPNPHFGAFTVRNRTDGIRLYIHLFVPGRPSQLICTVNPDTVATLQGPARLFSGVFYAVSPTAAYPQCNTVDQSCVWLPAYPFWACIDVQGQANDLTYSQAGQSMGGRGSVCNFVSVGTQCRTESVPVPAPLLPLVARGEKPSFVVTLCPAGFPPTGQRVYALPGKAVCSSCRPCASDPWAPTANVFMISHQCVPTPDGMLCNATYITRPP